MTDDPMHLTLRYMRLSDVSQVVNIDRLSFDSPWSANSYTYEISESSYSHMMVLELDLPRQTPGWRRWVRALSGRAAEQTIVGYGGLWHIAGEAHISTIATHPLWRGRGWGEILLAAMVRRSMTLDAEYVVLEVRVSNTVAQNLYLKYGFTIVDTKPNYYRSNGEDAYDMRLNLTDAVKSDITQRYTDLRARLPFDDHYTTAVRD